MTALATAVQDATYSPAPPSDEAGAEAMGQASEIERIAHDAMTRQDRLRTRFHPRRLWDG